MEKSYEELKAEATGLGLDFKGNVKKAELEQLIENYYESQAAGDLVKEVEDKIVEEPKVTKTSSDSGNSRIARRKAEAYKKRVVIISNIDKRDSDISTTAYLSFENQFFGLSRLVPLDIPVELEEGLIEVAKKTEILTHIDEIVSGKRTGNKIPKLVKKYNVSFEDVK